MKRQRSTLMLPPPKAFRRTPIQQPLRSTQYPLEAQETMTLKTTPAADAPTQICSVLRPGIVPKHWKVVHRYEMHEHSLLEKSEVYANQLVRWTFRPYDSRYVHFWHSRLLPKHPKYVPPPTKFFELLVDQNVSMERYAFLFFNPHPPPIFQCKESQYVCVLAHQDPNIWLIRGAFSSAEYAALAKDLEEALLKKKFSDSQLGEDSFENKKQRKSCSRRMVGWTFKPKLQFLKALCSRLGKLTGIPITHLEEPQQLMYTANGFFSVHHDTADEWFAGSEGVAFERWNQLSFNMDDIKDPESSLVGHRTSKRLMSALLYMNTLEGNQKANSTSDGSTYFPWCVSGHKNANGMRFLPTANTLVLWSNFHPNYSGALTLDPRTLHAGNPIPKGSLKYAINLWFLNKCNGHARRNMEVLTDTSTSLTPCTDAEVAADFMMHGYLALSQANEACDPEYRDYFCENCGEGNTMSNYNDPNFINAAEIPVLDNDDSLKDVNMAYVQLVKPHKANSLLNPKPATATDTNHWCFEADVQRFEELDTLLLCSAVTESGVHCKHGICVDCFNSLHASNFEIASNIQGDWYCYKHSNAP